MADSDVSVQFTADVADFLAGVDAAKAQLKAFADAQGDMASRLQAMGTAGQAAAAGLQDAVKATTDLTGAANASARALQQGVAAATQTGNAHKSAAQTASDAWDKSVQHIAQVFGSGIEAMIAKGKSLSAAMAPVGQAMVQDMVKAVAQQSQVILNGQKAQTDGQKAAAAAQSQLGASAQSQALDQSAKTAMGQITNAAASAAAGAYSAAASIPVIGPFVAPALAAAAMGAVEGFSSRLFSAEGGMAAVPYDNAPFLLHKNEMVLPASLANPLRAQLQGDDGAQASGPFAASGGGDTHVHIHAVDARSVQRLFSSNNDAFAKAFQQTVKQGRLSAGMG